MDDGEIPDFEDEDSSCDEPDLPEVLREQAQITEEAAGRLSRRAELLRQHADELEESSSSSNDPEDDTAGEDVGPVRFIGVDDGEEEEG